MRGILPACRDGYTKAMVEFPDDLDRILEGVASGSLSPSATAQHLRNGEVRYLDEFAVLDVGRPERKGVPEVVYARGKTPSQVSRICEALLATGGREIVRATSPEHEEEIRSEERRVGKESR